MKRFLVAAPALLALAGPALAQGLFPLPGAPTTPNPDVPQLPHSMLLQPMFNTLDYSNNPTARPKASPPPRSLQSYGNGIAVQPQLPPGVVVPDDQGP